MVDSDSSVRFEEAISVEVGNHIVSKGYGLAGITGHATSSIEETEAWGILWKDPNAKPVKKFFGLIQQTPRRVFIGVIWLKRDVSRDDKREWYFEFYGRKNTDLVKNLANELFDKFGVKITLRLVNEHPKYETYHEDYDF